VKKIKAYLLALALLLPFISTKAAPADTTITFVNFYPGSIIYELEGHSALHITMPGADLAVNFGLFDFNKPNFVYRFVSGQTDYYVGTMPWLWFTQHYIDNGRRIVEHELNLTSEQKYRLLELLKEHLRPENCTYRYNYVKDNCATRPLRMVELAVGDTIILGKSSLTANGEQVSFRDVMRHYHRNYPWYQFGIDLALGSGIDYKLNQRETAFAPALLDSQLADAKTGSGTPLVSRTIVYNDTPEDAAIEGPTPVLLSPIFICSLVLLLTIWMCYRDQKRHKVSKWFDTVLFAAFGLTGLLLTFLIFVSTHEATSPNYLYAWLNPLCFIPAIFIWLKKGKMLVYYYQIANFAVLLLLMLAWYFLPQSANPAFLPLILAGFLRSASYINITRNTNQQKANG
jgi:hypothetical protein